jgi:hypothetical protein
MSNNKQSSVEWFFKWVNDNYEATNIEFANAFEQAKAMHKQEMIKFTNDYLDDDQDITAEQYYNETFGGNNEQ